MNSAKSGRGGNPHLKGSKKRGASKKFGYREFVGN